VRVLIAHSAYLSGPASGENQVVIDEARLLERAGHSVEVYSPSARTEGVADLMRTGAGTIWSREASRRISELVRDQGANVLHVHNLYPALSPAVIRSAYNEGAAVVMTLHNYRMHCLPGTFLRDGKVCELCQGKVPVPGVRYRCYRDSAPASAILATSMTLHRKLNTFDRVSIFLAVTSFIREKHLEAGMPAERVRVKPNFSWPGERRIGPGEFFIFLGRLAPEKGVSTLLRIWKPEFGKLLIVGGGPEEEELRRIAPDEVDFLGSVPGPEARAILARARALLVPSRWYEGAPRTIVESYASGVPVVASRIGGLAESVEEGLSGFLVPPDSAPDWAAAITALSDDSVSESLSAGAYRLWEERYTPAKGLAMLEGAYRDALTARHPRMGD
jgi:glycosyltransferase involved in cell wall biosynthesis